MSRKVLVLMEVQDEHENEGIKFATQEAFGKDVTVHQVSNYPIDTTTLQADYLDIFNDADIYLSDYDLTSEQLVQIAIEVGEIEANDGEERNNRICEAAKKFGFIKEEEY